MESHHSSAAARRPGGPRRRRGHRCVPRLQRGNLRLCPRGWSGSIPVGRSGGGLPAETAASRLSAVRLSGKGRKQAGDGANSGNSPLEIIQQRLCTGRTMVHTTSAGTQGLENATGADVLLAGALVNAGCHGGRHPPARIPQHVSLVCMGLACRRPTDEDTLLRPGPPRLCCWVQDPMTRKSCGPASCGKGDGQRFFIPAGSSPSPLREDFDLCTQFDRFPFALPVRYDPGWAQIHRKSRSTLIVASFAIGVKRRLYRSRPGHPRVSISRDAIRLFLRCGKGGGTTMVNTTERRGPDTALCVRLALVLAMAAASAGVLIRLAAI